MTDFVVWLKDSTQIQDSGRDLGAEFQKQMPTLASVFLQHARIKITMTGDVGIHCEAANDTDVDDFEKELPPQWAVDRTRYTVIEL